MDSFKVIVRVAANAVITYVRKLYPGSISDKEIVKQSGQMNHLASGDLILADKGFLIQDIVPKGVSVNIPPFLQNGKFTASEIMATKNVAKCRIHVERANARLKDFKIRNSQPLWLDFLWTTKIGVNYQSNSGDKANCNKKGNSFESCLLNLIYNS